MQQINIHEAKTHLSRLIERILEGEEIVIARHGKPVACLVPFKKRMNERIAGGLKGKIKIADDFDAPII
ncbi:MAG: type II toxin-antitoxin system prevent-host-death family antitoxin [Aquificaceae bacterium]|nr:MAG: type II toxin-antitoxin system prevent-host-death family antitoxin [Aquificaceae bacterium]